MSLLCLEASWSNCNAQPRRIRFELGAGVLLLLARLFIG